MKFNLSAFLICALLLSVPSLLISQDIKWGGMMKTNSQLFTPHIIGEDANFFYSISTQRDDVFLEKYNKSDLKRQYSKLIETLKINKKELQFEGIYFMTNKFTILASLYNKADHTMNLYAYIYDGETGKVTDRAHSVLTVPVDTKKLKGNFSVFVSNDRSKILVNHTGYYPDDKSWKDRYVLLDEQLEKITERDDVVFKNEIDFTTSNYIIDNEGSFYYLKHRTDKESFIVSYDANHDYEKWEAHIDLSDVERSMRVYNMSFMLNAEHDLMLVGHYTTDEKNLKGTFAMKISTSSKEIVLKKVNEFDNQTIKKLKQTNIFSKKDIIPVGRYNRSDLSPMADGGFIQICESFSQDGSAVFFADIMVAAHDSKGELLWTQRIPKSQFYNFKKFFPKSIDVMLKEAEFMSYSSIIQNGKLMIYHNDKRKNAPKSRDMLAKKLAATNLAKVKKTVPVCYTLDLQTGETDKKIMSENPNGVFFKPVLSYQNEYDQPAFFVAQFHKNLRFGIIDTGKIITKADK